MADRVCEVFSNREQTYHTYCYKCLTCGEGQASIPYMCETCRDTCHAGHNTSTDYYNYFVCGCGNGEYAGTCQAIGGNTQVEDDNKVEVKIETKEGWLEEQGLSLEEWSWKKRYFILFPDRLEIHEKQPEEKKAKPLAAWPYDKLRLIDRFPKSPKFDVYSATGAIEVQASSPTEKKEWLKWVASKKKGVARTLKTIAIQTTKKDGDAAENAGGGKAAAEARALREKRLEIIRKLPVWKHPAFIGHFCDVSFPSVTLEKIFDEDEVLMVNQCIDTLMRIVDHASGTRRAALSTFDDAQVKNLSKVGTFFTKLKTTFSELQTSINWKTQAGMSKFLLKFTKTLKAMKTGEVFPFMHPNFKHVIFIAERAEKSFTFVISTLDKGLLAYHPFSLDDYPKIKYQNCLRISDINVDKFLDTSTWTLLFCFKQIDHTLIYQILVPFFMEGRVYEDGKLQGEAPEVKKRLDFYQTQPRSDKYVFYRSLLTVLRYFIRSMGVSHAQTKQLFYVLRVAYLDQVSKDLVPLTKTETADKVLITVACDQAFRAAEKCQVHATIGRAEVVELKNFSQTIMAEVLKKFETDVEKANGFSLPRITPFAHFHGFGFVGDSRSTQQFVDGPIDIIPEMFTDLAPPKHVLQSFGAVFDQIQQTRSRCYIMRAKASSSSDAVVAHQITAMIHHAFTEIIPLPSPRATPAAIFKCPYSTAKEVKLETQREALRSLLEIMQEFVSASLACEFSSSQNHATRCIIAGSILAVFDAVIRIQAFPLPSPVSDLLCSEQGIPVFDSNPTTDKGGKDDKNAFRKTRTIAFKGYWLPDFDFERKTTDFPVREPKLLLARDAVLRYFKQSQEAKSPQLFAWTKPPEKKEEAAKAEAKDGVADEAVKGDGFDDLLFAVGESFNFATTPVSKIEANNNFLVKAGDYTIDFVNKLLTNVHGGSGGSNNSSRSDLSRYANALITSWEPENVPEFAYYRDVVAAYLLGLQYTGRDTQQNLYTSDVRPNWSCSDSEGGCLIAMNLSGNLTFGEPPKNKALCATYTLETSEEKLLHQDIDKKIFGDSLNLEEVERLASYLTVEYLRIPLVLEFFSQDRCSSLINPMLRDLLDAVLFEPLAFVTEVKTVMTIPIPEMRKAEYLGTRFGILMEEVVRAPLAILGPLSRIIQGSIKLCVGNYTSLFVPVLMFAIRLSLSVTNFFYEAIDAEQIRLKLAPRVQASLEEVEQGLIKCEGMLHTWIAEALEYSDKKPANEFHVHLTLIHASRRGAPTRDSVANFLGSGAFAISMYHKNMDLTNIPIQDLFFALQRRRLAILNYSEGCPQKDLEVVLDRMVEVAIRQPPEKGEKKWAAVMQERSPRTCEYKITTSHPYEVGTDFYTPVSFPGVERIALYFHELTALNPNDFITIYKDETHSSYWGNEARIFGSGPWPGAGGRDPLIIPAQGFILYFHSHKQTTTTKWGFELVAKAPLSPALVDQLVRETNLSRIVCLSALADANHDIVKAKEALTKNGGLSAAAAQQLEADSAPRKLPGLYSNRDNSLQINIQTCELYLHKLGSLRELPIQFANTDAFERVFKTRDNSNFRCSIKAHDRNRQVVIFNHTDPSTGYNCFYEVVKWDRPKIIKDTRSLFDMLALQDRHQANEGGDMLINRQLLEADLDGLPEKGYFNMPTRDDTGIQFLGQRFLTYTSESCGWLSVLFDAVVKKFESSKPSITMVWISEHTLNLFNAAKAVEEKKQALKQAEEKKHEKKDASKTAKQEDKKEGEEKKDQPPKEKSMHGPPVPKVNGVIGSMLMFAGRPGNFFQVDVLGDRNFHVYLLFEHGRKCQRKLVYATDARSAFFDDIPATSQDPNDAANRPPAEAPFSSGKLYQLRDYAESLIISRDSGPFREPRLGEEEKETFYNDEFFEGLIPACLIAEYEFWKTGPFSFRGYPKAKNGETQLLIILQLQVCIRLNNGEFVVVNAEALDTGDTVRQRAAKKLGVADWKTIPAFTSRGQALGPTTQIFKGGLFEWGARVSRLPFALDKEKVKQIKEEGEPPMLLLNMVRCSADSALGKIAQLLRHIERFSHLLVWSKSAAKADSEECEVSLVELPRLRMSFVAEQVGGEIRLYSQDYDGLYIDTSFDDVYKKWVGDIPHALILKNGNKESFLLIPNYGLKRLQLEGSMFPTKLVLDVSGDWARNVSSRYFVYPVHSSGAFLVTTSTGALLYLIVTHLMTMEYAKCGHLLENCVIEEKLTTEETYILTQVKATKSDQHPDACGLRLRLALLCILSDNKPPFEFADDYALYLQNSSHVSSPFRISAEHELKLDPPAARRKWLSVVAANKDAFDIWHRKPPQNSEEIADFLRGFVAEFKDELSGYEDLREVMEKHLLTKSELMSDEEVKTFWSKDWAGLKAMIKTGFDAYYAEREKQAQNQDEGEDRELVVVRKDATEAMNRILIKVLRGFFGQLQTFQEEPPVATAAKYVTFLQSVFNRVKKETMTNSMWFNSPKAYELQGDNAVRGIHKLLAGDLTKDSFVMVYQMLMGHVQPDVLPAKDESQTEDTEAAADDISKFIAYRRPPRNLTLIRLILRAAAVTTGGNLQTAYLTILLHAVDRQDTSLFPSYPTVMFNKDQGTLPVYEKFSKDVQDACQEYVRRGNWTIPDMSYLDLHPAQNYEPVKLPMKQLKDEFQPSVIRDMSCSSRRAIPVKHELEALNVTSDELNVFATQPLNVGTIFQKNILVEVSKNSGDVDDLPWHVDKASLSPCEDEVIDQMQQDLIESSKGDSSDSRLSYLNPKHIQMLHHSITDPKEAKTSGDVLANALAQLQILQKELEILRDKEAQLVRQGRVNVEEIANKGTAQLSDESVRLKFEFLIAALLQSNSSLTEYNSKLTTAESDLVFSCLIGVCLRSIRLAQTKLALVNLGKLRSAIRQFLASRVEAKWSSLPEGTATRPDNLPIPTRTMVSHCLETAKFIEKDAHALLTSILKDQHTLAKSLESEQKLNPADSEKAAKLMVHLAKFNLKSLESKLEGRNLIDLGNRGCYFRGATLNYPTLSKKENSATGMSFEAMVHVIHATSQGLADVLAERRAYMHLAPANKRTSTVAGAPPPPPGPPSHVFDPRFLVFEYAVNFMVRKRQVELVLSFVDAATAKKPRSCVNQMIMGAGKTTVIAPLLSLILANGDNLIMLVIPKALLDMGLGVMRNVFSNIIKKKVFVFDFARSISDEAEVRGMYLKLKKARVDQSIVCCTPEAIKALMLKYIDLLEETRASNPALYIPKKHFGTHYLWEQVEKMAEDITKLTKTADVLADILCLWREKGVALLDEVDTLLHPLRSELNFPVGKAERLDMVENGDRFIYPIFLYDAFFFAQIGRTCVYNPTDSEQKILVELSSTIKQGTEKFAFQTFPHPILLQKAFYKDFIAPLMARWSYIWTSKHSAIIADAKKLNAQEMETNVLTYTTTRRIGDHTDYVAKNFSQDSIKCLNLARDWLTMFIPHTISKINRVDYGLLQESHLAVWEAEGESRDTQSKARLLMAVPFVGKDVPSRHSEFAHPEVLIGLSILSYRYQGLRDDDLKKIVRRLKESMQQEPGTFVQRPSRIRFNDWINLYELNQRREKKKMLKILPLELFPPDMGSQMKVLSTAFGKLPEIIDFWLTQVAFPETLKYQLRKLQASGVDLGSDMLFKIRLGFSGTPSNMLPIDIGKCGFEPGCQAKIVRVMASPKFTKFSHLKSGWTVESLLTFVAQHNPPFHALIDTGALVTGFSNKEVAEFMLKVGLEGMECCVYLDDADRKMVINRAGVVIPFNRSGVAPERRFTFFDQVHTTGMDIKQGVDACAATTLGKDMTLRDHSQGIYRMRGLGNGQTVHLLIVPEVLDLIFRVVSTERRNDKHILVNVVHWLTNNGLRSFNQQYMALCQQNLNNLYRKEAFKAIVESRQPLLDEKFVTQNRFCYCPPSMTEKEASELLEKNPLMNQSAYTALMNQYDIAVTFEIVNPSGGSEGREAEYTVQIENESMLVSKMMSTLMDMVSKDIVNSNELQVMLIQGKIKYTIVDDFHEEIKEETTKPMKLKDIDTVCHPKRARLSEVEEEEKDKKPGDKEAEKPKDGTKPKNPEDEKKEVRKVKKFREFPHICVKLQTGTKEFALFAKHFQPKGGGATKAVDGALDKAAVDDKPLDASTMKPEELEALLAKMTPDERKKWNRDQKMRALEALEGKENKVEEEKDTLTIWKELEPMTDHRFRWLRRCLLLFCEDLVLDVEMHVTRPKKFSAVLQDLAHERSFFVATDETYERVEMVIDQVVRTEDALIRKLKILMKAAEDEGQNLDTELVQESEQEQEAIQQTASGGESKVKFAPLADRTNFWKVTDLSSASCMLDNNFYPLGQLEEVQPMRYPPYVLLSQNYLKAINTSVNRRRLKNVYVVATWIPKYDSYDTEDNTEQMLALLEGECLNPAQMLRLVLEDEGKGKDKKKKVLDAKDADVEPAAKQKPYIIALSLQEAESLRRVIQMFMGPDAPALGDRPLLEGTQISLASLNGLWLTDEIVKPGVKSKPIESQLFLEPGYQVGHFDLGRQSLRFFNCSIDLTKDDVIMLIHALEGQEKEVRKKSYAQAIESRKRVRKTCNGTNLELVFLTDAWNDLARIRDFSVRVLEAMKSSKMSFAEIDENGDGMLSRSEFSAALSKLPTLQASEEMLTELLSYVDENNDGMMNYREFCAIFLGVENVAELSGATNADDYEVQAKVAVEEEVKLENSRQRTNSVLVPNASKQAVTAAPDRDTGPRAAHEVWEWTADLGQPYLRSGGSAQLGFDDLLAARPEAGTLTVGLRGVKLYQNSYYFEVRVVQPGAGVIGVIDECFVADSKTGLAGPGSWGFDGKQGCLFSNGAKLASPHKWVGGDVIGVLINLVAKEVVFTLNGKSEFAIKGVSFQGSLCPAVSFNSTFSAYLNIGTQPLVHRPASTLSVIDWVKIKMETVYALQTGHFFSVESNAPFNRLLNTKKLYDLTNSSTNFRQGIMLEGHWYYEFTLVKGVCEKNDFVLGQQVYNEHNSNTWITSDYDNNETRNVFSKEGTVVKNFAVRDTVGVAYNCAEGVVTMSVNGRWIKKSFYTRKHRILHGHRPMFNVVTAPTATISVNFGHLPFKFCPPNYKSILDWLKRVNIFKESTEDGVEETTKVEDTGKEELDEYEQYEAKLDEERAEIAARKTHVTSTGGGAQIKLQARTGQCAVSLAPSFNEEAKTRIQVQSTQAYPTVVAGDVNLTMGMWYYEIYLDTVAAPDRAVFGWVHPNFVPDSQTGVGVGDTEFTWGLQLQTSTPILTQKFFRVNEKEEKTEAEIRAELERSRVKEVPDYAETITEDVDAEEVVAVEEKKAEEKQVEKKAEEAVKVSKGSLIRTDDQVWESKDVIGCAIDFTNKLMSFSRNGDWNPKWRIRFSTEGLKNQALRPAFSLSTSVRVLDVFFGNIDNPEKQFIHPPPKLHFALNLCFDKRILNHFSGGVAGAEDADTTVDDSALTKVTVQSPRQIEAAAKAAMEAAIAEEAAEEEIPIEVDDDEDKILSDYKSAAHETEEGKKLLLWDKPRKYRKKWRQYLQEVSKIEVVENTVNRALHLSIFGDMKTKAPEFGRQLLVFLSSTFTDTQMERDLLISDVHPYLRELALLAGFQYAALEMRWGIREEAANSHATYQICMDEILRCLNDSRGVAYVAILADKYGYRPFPADIPEQEFKLLCSKLPAVPKTLMEKWFEPDHNAVPPVYNLRALTDDKLRGEWWGGQKPGEFAILQKELRLVAHHLPEERARRYVMSVTEGEVWQGLLNFDKRDDLMKSFCFTRRFGKSAPPESKMDKTAAKFVDYMDNAQSHLNIQIKKVEEKLKKSNLGSRFREYKLEYDPAEGICLKKHKMYLRSFVNHYCQLMCESLLVAARRHAQLASDTLLEEVTTHTSMALRKNQGFTGRVPELETIMAYIRGSSRLPFVVCGNSGSGKTALMAKAALMCCEVREYFMIVRFLGTSMRSSSAAELMRNLCIHLGRIYGQSNANVPFNYSSLKSMLKVRLNFPTPYCPLVIFLDSLDQMNDEDQGRELKWLPHKLPKNVRLIVSCIGDEPKYKNTGTSAPYRNLELRKYPTNTWLHVLPMSTVNSNAMLDAWLTNAKRKLTDQQHQLVSAAFGKSESSRLPLYARLVYDLAIRWRSTTLPPPLPNNITDIIRYIFGRLEKEHGKIAPAALSYITCSKYGLSSNELEDVLSLDDEVLNDVFQWWNPPLRRIPPNLWIRLRTDIQEYLVERGAQGLAVYSWFHRQFKEVVLEMWLNQPTILTKRHNLLAEYFSGKYANGKAVVDAKEQKGAVIDRRINPQKLILSRTKTGARYNRRRLAELPHHLIHAHQWEQLVDTLCNFEFLTAKCEVSSINQLVSDFVESIHSLEQIVKATPDPRSMKALQTLQEYKNFLVQHATFIGLQPRIVYNLARNMPEKSAPCQGAIKWFEAIDVKRRNPWLKQIYKPQAIYPGITELQCPSLVTAIALSPDNSSFAVLYGSDQVSLKIYESLTFEEVSDYKFSRTPPKTDLHDDPVQNFYNQEEIDWFGRDRIVLMLDTVSVVNVVHGTVVLSCPPCDYKLVKCHFSQDGSRLVCQGDGYLVIYDANSGAILNQWDNIIYGALSPSNNVLAYVEKPKPTVGDDVRAGWRAGAGRFPGFIAAINKDGTYFVQFMDGDFDRECPESRIDLQKDQSALKILDARKYNEVAKRHKEEVHGFGRGFHMGGGFGGVGGGFRGGFGGGFGGGYGGGYDQGDYTMNIGFGTASVATTTAKTGALERFGHIDRAAVKRPELAEGGAEKKDVNYSDYTLSVTWSSTSQLAAVLPSGEVLMFDLDEKGMKVKKRTLARDLVVPAKPLSCTFSADAKWLFVLSASTFHFVEASSGLVSGILTQDYMRSVANAKLFKTTKYCISVGGANRTMKLWDLDVVWDHAVGKKLIDRVEVEEKKTKAVVAAKQAREKERIKAGEKKKHEDLVYTTKERAIGHPLELDVDAQWTPNGKSLIFLSIDLSSGNPVSVIKTLALAELEAPLDDNGQREVTVRKLELPVPQADDPKVTFTKRGMEKIEEDEKTETERVNTATTSSIVTKKVKTTQFTVTTVDRAPACLAWSPSDALHVVSGVAYLGVPRPKTFGAEVGLELRKRDGAVITPLRSGSIGADPVTIKFSPDSQFLAGAFERGDGVCMWQLLSTDKTMTKLSVNGFIKDFVFSKDSKNLLCATSTHLLYVKIAQQQAVASQALTLIPCSVAMSFEPHKYVAVGTETGSVMLYKLDFVPDSSNMALTHLHTWQAYGPEHASQKVFGVGFIRNTGILVTIGDSVIKVWHCGGPKVKPKEIARYYARFLLAKMAVSKDGVIALFGHRGIDPLILAVESLENYFDASKDADAPAPNGESAN